MSGPILVTGATGLLGSALSRHWAGNNSVVALSHKRLLRWPSTQPVSVDLADQKALRAAILSAKPALVVHAAGWIDLDGCEKDPKRALLLNGTAAGWAAAAAAEAGAAFVFISTDGVFDGERGGYAEGDEPRPINAYARSKLLGEQETIRLHPSPLLLRTGVEGWRPSGPAGFVQWVIEGLTAGRRLTICEDWTRSIVFTENLGPIIDALRARSLSGLFHVCADQPATNLEFARLIARVFGLDPAGLAAVQSQSLGLPTPRPSNLFLDNRKLAAAIGPKVWSVKQGLDSMKNERDSGRARELSLALMPAAAPAPR